ncbi:MAG: sigma-70 family RNA polymerase sigma factor [Thermomicrobiales bacterium]|nr:sigma-70 family RNA polymerase sigma factor [Thermomicrobiales bacterium]
MTDERERPEADDEQLVQVAQRDPSAFAPLYRRYVGPIYAFAYQRLGTRELAEDATSQVFVQALAALPGYRAGTFRAWLYAIARNVVTDLHRARPVDSLDERMATADPTPDEVFFALDREIDLRALLARLTPEQRDVVELRLAGLNGPEIAHALDRSPGAVRALQFRAYQQLRTMLDPKQVTK